MICPNTADDCTTAGDCIKQRCWYTLVPPIGCLHFVGFSNDRYWNAVRAFGLPDIIHRVWDERARVEIGPDDVAVFAEGDEHSPTYRISKNGVKRWNTWDDSHEDIVVHGGPRER